MKKLIRSIFAITILLGLFSLFGCNSTEPSNPTDSLLAGQILLDAKGFQDYYLVMVSKKTSVNGSKQSDITMTIRNKDTQQTLSAKTDKSGVFYFLNPQPGNYVIDQFSYKIQVNAYWESITVKGINIPFPQQLGTGKVYNMGLLHLNAWVDPAKQAGAIATLKSANDGLVTLTQENSFDKLKNSLAQKQPQSQWLKKDWVNLEIPPLSQPAAVKFDFGQIND